MLSVKKEAFCQEYVMNGGVGNKAAEAAGYASSWAPAAASKMLLEYEVAARIEELREEMRTDGSINRLQIIQELKGVGFANITDYLQISGSGVDIKEIDKLPRHKQIAIAEISETSNDFGGSSVKLKLHPKLQALEKLLKMAGFDGPIEGDKLEGVNTLEEGNFVLKRRKRSKEADTPTNENN
jgi:phage terminase small subunit